MRFTTAPWGMLSLLLTKLCVGIIILHHVVPHNVMMVSACISVEQKEEIIEGKKTLFSFVAATDLLALENPLERSDWEDALFVHWQLKTENLTAFEQELGLMSSSSEDNHAHIANVAILKADEEKKPYLSMMVKRVSLVGLPDDTVQIDWMIYVTTPEQTEPTLMVIDSLYDFRATTPVGFTRASRRLTYNVESNKVSLAANKEDPDALRVFLDLSKTSEGHFDSSFTKAFDKLYWPNMVYSKLFTNGSLARAKVKVANKKMDAAEGSTAAAAAFTITGNLPWSEYTLPNPTHITYVPNTIQMGSEVWVNAKEESRLLLRQRNQIYKERARLELSAVTNGEREPKVLFSIADSAPSYFINFIITDPEGLADAIPLPEGFSLAPIKFREHGQEDFYLTLNVYGIEGLENGIRAEWKVFVKEEGSDFPNFMLIQITSNNMSPIPVDFNLGLPFKPAASTFVNQYQLEEGDDIVVTDIRVTNLRERYSFYATFPNPGACTLTKDDDNFDVCDRAALDFITAHDRIYYRNGIYDVGLWDASVGAMTFSVVDPSTVFVSDTTKWTDFIESRPHEVLVFFQEGDFMLSPWNNAEEIDTCDYF